MQIQGLTKLEWGGVKLTNSDNKISNTITTAGSNFGVVVKDEITQYTTLAIRRFTPKECLRLMGLNDNDIEKLEINQSNASLYHLAGDSIVVDVLCAIFKQML